MFSVKIHQRFIFIGLVLILSACGTPQPTEPISTPLPQPYPDAAQTLAVQPYPGAAVTQTVQPYPGAAPTVPNPMVFIEQSQSGQIITLHPGQVLFMINPDPTLEWQIDYATEILESILPSNEQKQSRTGWYFRALSAGQTDLAFTSVAKCENPPCPPTAMHFVFSIEVKP
jgi:hypothetical protein